MKIVMTALGSGGDVFPFFNANAQRHAQNNNVALYDQNGLAQLLRNCPVRLLDVERLLYTQWDQA